jgi:hypothetical protein
MIGANLAVVRRAAGTRLNRRPGGARIPARKNTE